jgi:hypothetical protein
VASPNLVGLLVVHGIGEQKPFDTVDKVISGLKAAAPDVREVERDEATGTVTIERTSPPARVRLYEVYWADLLTGETSRGAFGPEKVQSAAWFPWLNLRRHLYPHPRPGLVLGWTILLIPMSALAYAGLFGARFFATLIDHARNPRTTRDDADTQNLGVLDLVRQVAEDGRGGDYGPLDKVLDLVAGDVFTYVAESTPAATPPTVADDVRQRFYRQAARASADGCRELHLLAHSLGTVVAFNALTGFRLTDADAAEHDTKLEIGRVWTIGSPLEKFAFLYPLMVAGQPVGTFRDDGTTVFRTSTSEHRPSWVNFDNPLDLVSGRLRSFPNWKVDNRRVWAGGAARSHTVYERNKQVIESLTEGIFGVRESPPYSRRTVAVAVAAALGESVAAVLAMILVMVVGAGFLLVLAALLPWLIGTAAGLVVSDSTEAAIKDWGFLFMGALLALGLLLLAPRQTAGAEHRRWLDAESKS